MLKNKVVELKAFPCILSLKTTRFEGQGGVVI